MILFMRLTTRRLMASCCLALFLVLGAWSWAVVTPEVGQPLSLEATDTRSEKLWSFGFVGDTHAGRETTERIFARLAAARLEFVLHLGDLVDRGDSDEQWEFTLAAAAENRLRIMPVVGNHDKEKCYDDRGEIRFRQYFPHLPRTFYHFRHRGLNFVVLNSERLPLPGSEQAAFLRWQLEKHPGPTIVCQHRPIFTASNRDWANMYLFRLLTHGALKGSDTTLVLCGHNHYYERTKPLDGITYVVSGGGAPNLYEFKQPNQRTAASDAGRIIMAWSTCTRSYRGPRARPRRSGDRPVCRGAGPTGHEPGSAENLTATELPPIAHLAGVSRRAVGAATRIARDAAAAVVGITPRRLVTGGNGTSRPADASHAGPQFANGHESWPGPADRCATRRPDLKRVDERLIRGAPGTLDAASSVFEANSPPALFDRFLGVTSDRQGDRCDLSAQLVERQVVELDVHLLPFGNEIDLRLIEHQVGLHFTRIADHADQRAFGQVRPQVMVFERSARPGGQLAVRADRLARRSGGGRT